MFSSSSKNHQRYNGKMPSSFERTEKSKLSNYLDCNNQMKNLTHGSTKNSHYGDIKYLKSGFYDKNIKSFCEIKSEVKEEVIDDDIEDNITAHSIIGLENKKPPGSSWSKKKINKVTHHETLQRIENNTKECDTEDVCNFYQKNWFSASLEKCNIEDRPREERIEITRHEFRRHLYQITRSNLGRPNKLPEVANTNNAKRCKSNATTSSTSSNNNNNNNNSNNKKHRRNRNAKPHQPGYDRLVAAKVCQIEGCFRPALPCTKHCTLHIMCNPEQILFSFCTAKFADNTQCSVPVFDITHELPLCPEHARKRDNYKLYQEAKPKKIRKKVKPSAMIRPQKRNKKKRRLSSKPVETTQSAILLDSPPCKEIEIQETIETESPELVEDMHIVDQVLGLNEADLTAQASHILEETDISTVLSTIHVDEFSDFFTVNRNGEFEQPSREETEELEKALAEVDNDVKSLEKLSQTHGLLDSLLDETALAEQLVQLPDVVFNHHHHHHHHHHNHHHHANGGGATSSSSSLGGVIATGYASAGCGDSVVAQTASFLLPVEPHSRT